ncbi:hypothetical protein [Nocardiopsis kunsanensis]|nr:hypothetical protein [Nocardiopsis kunsanensis]
MEIDNRTNGSLHLTTGDVDRIHIQRTLRTSPCARSTKPSTKQTKAHTYRPSAIETSNHHGPMQAETTSEALDLTHV